MGEEQIMTAIGNLDSRVARIEQFLPTLSTREELARAIAPLATREDLTRAIAPLATREELARAIAPLATREELARAIAPLATREELERRLLNLRDELREEILQSRRRADVLIEDLRDDTRLILEHLLALSARVDALAGRG